MSALNSKVDLYFGPTLSLKYDAGIGGNLITKSVLNPPTTF